MSENADETGPTHVPEGARELFRDDDVIVYATADKRVIGYTRDVGRFEVLEAPEDRAR